MNKVIIVGVVIAAAYVIAKSESNREKQEINDFSNQKHSEPVHAPVKVEPSKPEVGPPLIYKPPAPVALPVPVEIVKPPQPTNPFPVKPIQTVPTEHPAIRAPEWDEMFRRIGAPPSQIPFGPMPSIFREPSKPTVTRATPSPFPMHTMPWMKPHTGRQGPLWIIG